MFELLSFGAVGIAPGHGDEVDKSCLSLLESEGGEMLGDIELTFCCFHKGAINN